MNEQQFKDRTRQVALRVIRLVDSLPSAKSADVLGRQLLRSGTSFGANYRAACRARSPADMISKLAIVEEEADETVYWLELLADARIVAAPRLSPLLTELNELVAMVVASQRTLKTRHPRKPGAR